MTLSLLELSMVSLLVLLCAALSVLFRLGLARSLLISTVRMVLQLLLVGEALRFVFALDSLWSTLGLVAVMITIAAFEVGARQHRRLANMLTGGTAVGLSTAVVAFIGLRLTLQASEWAQPRYVIPLVGIVLGSALNAASLALHHLSQTALREAKTLETRLALGHTRDQAFAPLVRGAMHAGLLPVINQMAAAGVVTLPGTMTGQLLAGLDPGVATRSQIFLMLLICAGAFFAALGTVRLTVRRFTDARERLRLGELRLEARQ